MESPVREHFPTFFDGNFSLLCTYHRNSDLPCTYGFYSAKGKFPDALYFLSSNESKKELMHHEQSVNFNFEQMIKNKTELVLWYVSNCRAKYRLKYAQALELLGIKIDIFGACGKKDPCERKSDCVISMFQKYKFYLAFENSNCMDYITEKVWKSLIFGMVPIISGTSIESCQYHLPPHSFLHINNFSTPMILAEYIHFLRNNDKAYFKYHEWRKDYTVFSPFSFQPNVCPICRNMLSCTLCKSIFDKTVTKIQNKSLWWKSQKLQCSRGDIMTYL